MPPSGPFRGPFEARARALEAIEVPSLTEDIKKVIDALEDYLETHALEGA